MVFLKLIEKQMKQLHLIKSCILFYVFFFL